MAELPALAPPHTLPLAASLAPIDRLIDDGYDPALLGEIAAFADVCWPAFDEAPRCLMNCDPHLENVLWDGARVSALLDLEWSQAAWLECDLEILLAVAPRGAVSQRPTTPTCSTRPTTSTFRDGSPPHALPDSRRRASWSA